VGGLCLTRDRLQPYGLITSHRTITRDIPPCGTGTASRRLSVWWHGRQFISSVLRLEGWRNESSDDMPRRKPGKQQPRRGENLGIPCSETLAFTLCNNAKPATCHRPVAQLCLFMSPFGNFPAMYQSDSHFVFGDRRKSHADCKRFKDTFGNLSAVHARLYRNRHVTRTR
jgi:hypothetical protein